MERHDTTVISIHALREEGDLALGAADVTEKFLSTPSARRATISITLSLQIWVFLSTPSARRATGAPRLPHDLLNISIHALREEGDLDSWHYGDNYKISIHALREEGDSIAALANQISQDFYPRPPRGGRQQKQRQKLYFQTNYTTFCTNLEEP